MAMKNFFAPLRTANMPADASATEPSSAREKVIPAKADRPPPIILTSVTNLIQLQKQIKWVVKQASEFPNTKNRIHVISKDMVDFQAVKLHFESNNLSFYSFPKSENPIKAVIHHLPINTPAEDMAEGLGDLGFACGVGATTCIQTVRRRATHLQYRHAVTANWQKETRHIPPTTAAASMLRRKCSRRRNHKEHPKTQLEGVSLPSSQSQMYLSLQLSEIRMNNRVKRSRAP
jgi:hypothetical protein